jgi:chorismate lyase/3-hydroxybenzoate synthase
LPVVHRRSGHLLKTAGQTSPRPLIAHPKLGDPPAWATRWAQQPDVTRLFTVRVPQVAVTNGPSLESATNEAYAQLLRQLADDGDWAPVRIWNYVPDLLGDGGEGLNRYMRFNAGRHRAFADSFGSVDAFDGALPAASAVGIDGDELIIHALACRRPGAAVRNPRQQSPHRYSQRFGPLPPCFARGTLMNDRSLGTALLVGGTASVRGEDSVHLGDLHYQLDETIENLTALASAAFSLGQPEALDCYRELRIYHVRRGDEPRIRSSLLSRFANVRTIEFVVADLCRPELLVEIEGVALLTPGASDDRGGAGPSSGRPAARPRPEDGPAPRGN